MVWGKVWRCREPCFYYTFRPKPSLHCILTSIPDTQIDIDVAVSGGTNKNKLDFLLLQDV
jgi:hypothetical protein